MNQNSASIEKHEAVQCHVAKRVREEEKVGFPYGLLKDMAVRYRDENVEGLAENEGLDIVNLLSYLGKDTPIPKKLCSRTCSFKHSATPVFFTDDPSDMSADEEDEVEEEHCSRTESGMERDRQTKEKKHCGLHQMSTSVITAAPLWFERAPEVVGYIPSCSEEDYSRRVKQELGFEFPPVMGRCMEQLVEEIWTKSLEQQCDEPVNQGMEAEYHSLVVDAQVKLARLLQAYIKRRSETGAFERDPVDDEREVAREVLGRHHSDIDTTSSESEEEIKTAPLDTPSCSSSIKLKPESTAHISSESSGTEQSVSDSTTSDDKEASSKISPQKLTPGTSQSSDSKAKTITRQKRRSMSAGSRGGRSKVQRKSLDLENAVTSNLQQPRKRALPQKVVESSRDDIDGISSESDSFDE